VHGTSAVDTVHIAALLHFGWPTPSALGVAVLVGLFVTTLRFDLTDGRVPHWSIFAACAAATVAAGVTRPTPHQIVVAATVGLGVPLAARLATRGGLGWGDVKLGFVGALVVGPVGAMLGFLGASLVALAGIVISRAAAKEWPGCDSGIAFGPYITASMLATALLGRLHD
jgi:leader peptidase (prepilin peptidase)/N-methyltransferase